MFKPQAQTEILPVVQATHTPGQRAPGHETPQPVVLGGDDGVGDIKNHTPTRRERQPSLPPTARTEGGRRGPGNDGDDVRFQAGDVVLSTYVIERQLGRGGMGTVYLGRDDVSGQRVAIKVLPGTLAKERDIRERFIQEARALAALDHPGIVPLITFAQEGDDRFLVMKYVGGRALEAHIAEHRVLSCDEARRIAREVVLALDYAHDHGVVHRDIKPANIVVDDHGRVVVVDFGIARKLEGEKRLTQTGMLMGTPQYMSPEQIEGKAVDGRADLYACGLLLFEMLAGRPPFDGDKTFDVLRAHVEKPVPDLRALRALRAARPGPGGPIDPDVPDALLALVHALLEKDPARRPQTGRAVADIIDGLIALPPASSTSSAPPARDTRETGRSPRPTSETPALAFNDQRDDEPLAMPTNPAARWAAGLLLVGVACVAGYTLLPGLSADAEAAVVDDAPAVDLRFQVGALMARAQVALERGAVEDARVAIDTALHLDEENVDALLLRARILVAGNNAPAATETLARLPAVLDAEQQQASDAVRAQLDKLNAPPPVVEERQSPKKKKTPKKKQPQAAPERPRPADLDDDELGQITRSSRAGASRCYVEHLLSVDGTAEGEVTLAVTVAPAGGVSGASVKKSPFSNAAFHDCLIKAVRVWKFPAFDGDDDVVVQKLTFRPG